MAAAERGRRVPVRANQFMTVADHDFTKFRLVPSVILVNNLPKEISGSWSVDHSGTLVSFTMSCNPHESPSLYSSSMRTEDQTIA